MNDKGEYRDLHQNESASIRRALWLGLACLMEYVLLLPAWILFAAFLQPPELPIAGLGLLPVLSLIGVLLGTRLRKLWQRGAAALAFGAVYTAAAFAWAGGASALDFGNAASAGQTSALSSTVVAMLQAAALFVAGVFCSLQGLTVRNRQGHFRLYWVGLGLYFFAGIFFPRIEALQAMVPLITWAGGFSLATALFVTNHQFLRYSSQAGDSGERLPAGLRRHNRLFVGVIVVAALLLAAGAGRWIGRLLWGMLQAIVRWLTRPQEPELPRTEDPEAVTPQLEPMLPAESQEPGLLSEILNYAFYGFGGLLLAALLGFVLYWLYKNAGDYWHKAINRLLNLLRRESKAQEQVAYCDEETSLLTWESALQGWRRIGARLLRTGKSSERWEDMRDNRERVRFLYRLYLQKERQRGFSLKPYLTPRELVEEIKLEAAQREEAAKASQGGRRKRIGVTGVSETTGETFRSELEAAVEPLLQLYYETRYGEELPGEEEVAELRRRLTR